MRTDPDDTHVPDPVLAAGRGAVPDVSGRERAPRPDPPQAWSPVVVAFVLVTVAGLVLGCVHLTQGTASLGLADLWAFVTGSADGDTREVAAVLLASRVPRLVAAAAVGVALGFSGTLLQSVARNPLASPDTLAVNAGAHLTLTAVAVFGVSLPFYLDNALALIGGLLGAALVLALSRGGADGPSRLILAGSAITLALQSLVTVLLVLFEEQTLGLFAWGSGSTVQSGADRVLLALSLLAVGLVAAVLLAHRLDLLALGDDAATVLGVSVRATRVVVVGIAVLLAATAVTVAGPIGFVGLAAPLLARLLSRRIRGLGRHGVLLPFAGLLGAVVVIGSDVGLRAVLPTTVTNLIPTGIVTTLLGAGLLVWFARRLPDGAPVTRATSGSLGRPRTTRVASTVITVAGLLLVGALVAGLLLGDRLVLLGDVGHYVSGLAGREVDLELGRRIPRVGAALFAGAALGLAGAITQAIARNPLAEPGLLGVSAGAGLGAVTVLQLVPGVGVWPMTGAALAGAALVTGAVFALAHRGGLGAQRLVIIGVGMQAGVFALITTVILATAPYDTNLALTWLAGSTYGRTLDHLIPVVVVLLLALPLVMALRRDLDVLALDDDTPRVLGLAVDRHRLGLLATAAALTAAAVCAVGVVGFVGLVAPHAARALVGARHSRVLPLSMILGALLVSLADTVGRTVLAPISIPVGVGTALLGAPYFIYLLWRTRGAG